MIFSNLAKLVSSITLISLSVILVACNQSTSRQPNIPTPTENLDPVQYFLVDFETKQVTALNSEDPNDIQSQAIYQPPNGVSYTMSVTDKQNDTPGIYDIGVVLTNNTGQAIEDKYGGIRVILTKFKPQKANGTAVPGGGVANARYMAESFRPFVLTTDFLGGTSFISVGATAEVAYRISLPAGATKAVIGLLTLGSSRESNTIPGKTVSYLTPMAGKFKTLGLVSGPAHLTRTGNIQSLAACGGTVNFFDNSSDVLWKFSGDATSWSFESTLGGTNVYGMDCFEEGLLSSDVVVALYNKNIIYISTISDDTIGDGTAGLIDGFDNVARFNKPRDVATLGKSIFVADSGNKAIRRIDVLDNGRYWVSTIVQGLAKQPTSITTDEIGNIYFLRSDGIYRIPVDTTQASKIHNRALSADSKLRWDGAGALVLADTTANKIFRIAPTTNNLNGAWDRETIAGDGNLGNPGAGGIAINKPVEKPIALSIDESGTIWYASLKTNQISRVDRIRK